jgi:hypothetical protein
MVAGLVFFSFSAVFPGEVKGRPLGDSARPLPHKRSEDFAETSFPARLYQKKIRIRRGAAMASSVYRGWTEILLRRAADALVLPDSARNRRRIAGMVGKFGVRLERRKSLFCLISSARQEPRLYQ